MPATASYVSVAPYPISPPLVSPESTTRAPASAVWMRLPVMVSAT